MKKRNGELVALAKKLEEKARRLQDELKEIVSSSLIFIPSVRIMMSNKTKAPQPSCSTAQLAVFAAIPLLSKALANGIYSYFSPRSPLSN